MDLDDIMKIALRVNEDLIGSVIGAGGSTVECMTVLETIILVAIKTIVKPSGQKSILNMLHSRLLIAVDEIDGDFDTKGSA